MSKWRRPGPQAAGIASKPFEAVPLVLNGTDPRLESECEVGRNGGLQFKAPLSGERFALYGPFASLPAGHYRFEVQFSIVRCEEGDVNIELCHRHTAERLYSRRCFVWELDPGLLRVSYVLRKPVHDLEIRLRVPGGTTGTVKQLSIISFPERADSHG